MRPRHRGSGGARPLTTKLLATASFVVFHGVAVAQNSTQAPPPSAEKIGGGGGADGDPTGAVRALGSGSDTDNARKPTVTVPRLGGEGESRPGGVPSGTSGGTRR